MSKTIVIDPGHGGDDPGAVAVDKTPEKRFTLALGLALCEALLAGYECKAVMTREGDSSLVAAGQLGAELHARAAAGNQAQAALFLSLHHDSTGSPNARGGSLWIHTRLRNYQGSVTRDYPPGAGELAWLNAEGTQPDGSANHDAPNGLRMAQAAAPHIKAALNDYGVPWGGVKCADFQVLRDSDGPGMLLEAFFGSSPADVQAARKPEFIPDLARALAKGAAAALDLKPKAVEQAAVAWDPKAEIRRLKERGVITSPHEPGESVEWGELATVMNRVLDHIKRS